jgi:hypothetical protein
MTIAANLKRFAEAMALQLPLPFRGFRRPNLARPTTRAARIARAARSAIRKAALAIKTERPAPKPVPPAKPTETQTMFQLTMALTRLEIMDMISF